MPSADRRLLLVHAHPDDETINNGGTMARHAAEGARVTLVTCTRGERGEIIPPVPAALASDPAGGLGAYRAGELAAALRALGVTDHRFLDAAGAPWFPPVTYRDSGMAYAPDGRVVPLPDPGPDAFALADPGGPAARLAAVIRELRPGAVVTYEPGGGYGHPDHVQAHRVTELALDLAAAAGPGGGAWRVPRVYWTVLPESADRAAVAAGGGPFGAPPAAPTPSMVVPDAEVTTAVDARAWLPAKVAALRCHRTQVEVGDGFYALSNGIGLPVAGIEYYRRVRGAPAGPFDADGRETDLLPA